jgi:hypothetical protein
VVKKTKPQSSQSPCGAYTKGTTRAQGLGPVDYTITRLGDGAISDVQGLGNPTHAIHPIYPFYFPEYIFSRRDPFGIVSMFKRLKRHTLKCEFRAYPFEIFLIKPTIIYIRLKFMPSWQLYTLQ